MEEGGAKPIEYIEPTHLIVLGDDQRLLGRAPICQAKGGSSKDSKLSFVPYCSTKQQ